MGGVGLLRPGPYTGISSYDTHRFVRKPPSGEPGTDYYMPTGTPIRAAADGYISDIGGSIIPATGRYIRLQMDMGLSIRYLHLSQWVAKRGQRVRRGDVIAISGASGYGSELFGETSRNARFWWNTGGDHVHVTLDYARKDPEHYMTETPSGGVLAGGDIITDIDQEDDDIMGYGPAIMSELISLRPIKLYEYGTGLIWVGPTGKMWIVPDPGFAILADALRIANPSPIMKLNEDQLSFITGILKALGTPDVDAESKLEEMLKLDPASVAQIVEGVAARPVVVTVTPEQLNAIAEAAAEGAHEGGAEGAKAAISGLRFVIQAV